MIQKVFRLMLNAVSVYITILAVWFLYFLFDYFILNHKTIDQEGLAFVVGGYVPMSALCNLVLIYALSILDRSILKPRYFIISTIFGEIVTFFSLKYIGYETALLERIAIMVIFFTVWHIYSRNLKNQEHS